MPHRAGRNELKPAQRVALAALNEETTEELTRGQYEQLTGVSRSQAAYDLAELVEGGLIERVGGGRSTRYRRPRRSQSSQRHWTNERIRGALVDFCAGRATWPSAGDFKAAGHADLYVAASRYGGIGFWASELGFSRSARAARPPRRPVRSIRPLLRWAAAGTAFLAVLFGVAGAVLRPQHPTPTRDAAGKQDTRALAGDAVRAPTHTAGTRPTKARAPQKSTRRAEPSIRREPSGYPSELAVQKVSARVLSPARQEPTQPSTSSAAPAPLPAPAGGGQTAPAPLPAPPR
jgi:DNA-binding transcriptional ArsR family regulator